MKPIIFPFVFTPFLAPALALVLPKYPAGLGLDKRQTCSMFPCDESSAILCSLLNCATCEGGVCAGTVSEDAEADSGSDSAASDLTLSLGSSGSLGLTGLTGTVPSSLPIDLSALTGSSVSAVNAGASINSVDFTAWTSSIPTSLPIDLTGLAGSIASSIPIGLAGLTDSVASTTSIDSSDSTALPEPVSFVGST